MVDLIDSSEFDKLRETINRKGFLLEDKAFVNFSNYSMISSIERNKVFGMRTEEKDNRVEIDLIAKTSSPEEKLIFIGECKRTVYTWLFPKALDRTGRIQVLDRDTRQRLIGRSTIELQEKPIVFSDVVIGVDGDRKIQMKNGTEVRFSFTDVHESIKQVLHAVSTYINEQEFDDGFLETGLFIPVIITNAKLGVIDYAKESLDEQGNLPSVQSVKEVPYVIYNFPEIVHIRNGAIQVHGDSRDVDFVKSVFIVNVRNIDGFLDDISMAPTRRV
jgi:hypothetical protein